MSDSINAEVQARRNGEKFVVKALVEHLARKGWIAFKANDGGDEDFEVKGVDGVLEAVFAVDECNIYFYKEGVRLAHHVQFVLGNSPEEVICDHSVGRTDDFAAAMDQFDTYKVHGDWIASLAAQAAGLPGTH